MRVTGARLFISAATPDSVGSYSFTRAEVSRKARISVVFLTVSYYFLAQGWPHHSGYQLPRVPPRSFETNHVLGAREYLCQFRRRIGRHFDKTTLVSRFQKDDHHFNRS